MIDYCLIITNQKVQLINLLRHLKENNITNIVASVNLLKTCDTTISILQEKKVLFTGENIDSLEQHYQLAQTLSHSPYVFFVHADEFPSIFLMRCLPYFLTNTNVGALAIPRMNYVIPPVNIDKLISPPDKLHRINWPDTQVRIFNNTKSNNQVYTVPMLEPYALLRINPLVGEAI